MKKTVTICDECGDEVNTRRKYNKCVLCKKDLCDGCGYMCKENESEWIDYIMEVYFGKNETICDHCHDKIIPLIDSRKFMEAIANTNEDIKLKIKKALILSRISGQKAEG